MSTPTTGVPCAPFDQEHDEFLFGEHLLDDGNLGSELFINGVEWADVLDAIEYACWLEE